MCAERKWNRDIIKTCTVFLSKIDEQENNRFRATY